MSKPYGLAADLHFHPWSQFASTTPDGMNTRLAGLLSELVRMGREVKAAGGDTCVLAGDIFHVRGSVAPTVLNAVRDTLDGMVASGLEFIILAGNHDLEGKTAERLGSAITALEMEGVTVLNAPMTLDYKVFVPWIEDIAKLKEVIAAQTKGRAHSIGDYDLILHAPIDGVITGIPDHGLTGEWLSDLGFRRVFAGHYHNHKLVHKGADLGTFKTGDVYSIGALAHHTWSDVGTRAGFLLVDDHMVNWRKSHLPAFIDIDKRADVDPEELPFLIDKNYVRMKVSSLAHAEIAALRAEIEGMGAAGVIIQAVPAETKREEAAGAPVVATGGSLEESVMSFVNGFAPEGLDKALLTKEVMSILGDALTLVED